jgi:hypothetical protein
MGDKLMTHDELVAVYDDLGYIIGKSVLHLPAAPIAPPSDEPGYGPAAESRCKTVRGGVYTRRIALQSVLNGHVCGICTGRRQFSILSESELAEFTELIGDHSLRSPLERRLGRPLRGR